MNRRSFLRLFGAGLPAVVVAEKVGLIDRVRSYFFAPKGGWNTHDWDQFLIYPGSYTMGIRWDQLEQLLNDYNERLSCAMVVGDFPVRCIGVHDIEFANGSRISRKSGRSIYPNVDFDKAHLIG